MISYFFYSILQQKKKMMDTPNNMAQFQDIPIVHHVS